MDVSFVFENDPEWVDFWFSETTKAWFLEQGYHLCIPKDSDFHALAVDSKIYGITGSEIPHDLNEDNEPFNLQDHPYPFPCVSRHIIPERFLLQFSPRGAVGFAQDSEHRIVALKFIKDGSEEYKCLRFVQSLDLSQTKDACILPVLDFLPCGGHWFVVMPFWSTFMPPMNCGKLRDVLDVMHQMLKALSFLHEHKIFHRDIKTSNFLFNFLPAGILQSYWNDPIYASLQSKKQLLYSIIDFGESIKFPDHYSYEQCRLPYRESWVGTYFIPDTMQGVFDFDPFAYDVGIMGSVFAEFFQHLTPLVPMLAPFIDKMITRNIPGRFTAPQALQFLEELRAELTEEKLMTPIEMTVYLGSYEVHDRWVGLPSEFIEKWADYREPPVPLSTRILRAVCSFHPWILYSMAWIRKGFHATKLWLAALGPGYIRFRSSPFHTRMTTLPASHI